MARSAESYGGSLSRTRTESLHYRCPCGFLFGADVHRVVNAARDPALADRLRTGTLGRVACPGCGQVADVQVSVVYHDEQRRQLALVLPPALRHRELEERADLLLVLARDRGASLPAYVVEFATVFGPEGLEAFLARRAEVSGSDPAVAPAPASVATFGDGAEVRTVIDDSTNRVALAQERQRAPAHDGAVERWALSRTPSAFDVAHDGEGRVRLLLRVGDRLPSGPLDVRVQLHRLPSYPLIVVTVVAGEAGADAYAVLFDAARPEDREALTALGRAFHLVLDFYDEAYDPVTRREVVLPLAANARFALAVADELLLQLPPARRSFEAAVAAWRAPGYDRIGRRDPRLEEASFARLPTPAAVQQALGVVAGWSEPDNEDYLLLVRSFPVDWWRAIRGRVVERAVQLGLMLSGTLMDVALAETGLPTRRELVARLLAAFTELCARPAGNDLGPDQVAANWRALFILCEADAVPVDARVAEVARQTPGVRPPLVVLQPRRSTEESLSARPEAPAAGGGPRLMRPGTGGGRSAHEETSRVPGPTGEEAGPDSADLPEGHLAAPAPVRPDLGRASADELLELLDHKDLRLGAALELVRRQDTLAVGPVFGAVRRMTRGEAVRVLPAVIQLGEHAVPHLVDGLRSRKAYLRQGCALALGVLKSAEGIDPLCDLLIGEPTEVWEEVARALGEIGPGAIMSLAARLRDPDASDPDIRERLAWALAHVAAKGGRSSVENLASGRDPAAAGAARRALELASTARENDAQVRGRVAGDVTVNRAFSKKFFEAMNGPPRAEPATLDSDSVVLLESGAHPGAPARPGAVESGDEPILEADEDMIEEALPDGDSADSLLEGGPEPDEPDEISDEDFLPN